MAWMLAFRMIETSPLATSAAAEETSDEEAPACLPRGSLFEDLLRNYYRK